MRITQMQIANHDGTTFAILTRKLNAEFIDVEIMTPDSHKTHRVSASDPDDQYSMACCIQRWFDGCVGTKLDIDEYRRAIEMMAY